MVFDGMKRFSIFIVLFMGIETSLSAPIEESKFLLQIADQYTPPLIISFLISQMDTNLRMIQKIKKSSITLDQSKRDIFDLAEDSHKMLKEQLITLEGVGYFNKDGSVKVKDYIDQFIMLTEFYPIDFSSYGIVNVGSTFDDILKQSKTQSFDKTLNQTVTLIESYLTDMKDKEVNCNHLQKLSITLSRSQLNSLREHLSVIKSTNNNNGYNNNYNNYNSNDPRNAEVEKGLKKLKSIVDLFYSQFVHLTNDGPKTSELTMEQQKIKSAPTVDPFSSLDTIAEIITEQP